MICSCEAHLCPDDTLHGASNRDLDTVLSVLDSGSMNPADAVQFRRIGSKVQRLWGWSQRRATMRRVRMLITVTLVWAVFTTLHIEVASHIQQVQLGIGVGRY